MAKNQPKVSVIIPVFNTSKFLKKCVNSVLKQTYKNLEVFLIDDGSTDNSGILCDDFAKTDKRVVTIHKQNGGLSPARNVGLGIATGEFIAFVDSDDFIEPTMIEVLLNNIIKAGSDISICSFAMETETGKPYADTPPLKNETYSKFEALALLNETRQDRFTVAWNKLYKKELFDGLRYPENKIHEDQWTIHKLFFKTSKVSAIEDVLYHYVVHEGSIMQAKNPIKHFDDIDALFDRIEFYKTNNLKELIPGVFKTMSELFAFYREKIWGYENFTLAELNKIYGYGKKCKKYLKNTAKTEKYSKEKTKEISKAFNFSFVDKLKLFYKNKLKVKKWKKI